MTDCSCDYEAPSFYRRRTPTARGRFTCQECAGPILPGERYERVTGKWDGYIDTFVTCEHCVDIRTWVKNNLPCFCWGHGNLEDDAKAAVEEAAWRAPAETAGLRFGLIRRIVRRDRRNRLRRAS